MTMGADFEVWLCKDDGMRLALLDDWDTLEYELAANDVGFCVVSLPGDWERTLFAADRKIEVWRKPSGGRFGLERAYLVRTIKRQTDQVGIKSLVLEGVDGNDLLRRRIVAYAAGSTEAKKTAAADDLMKALANQNLSTGATDTDRALSTGYFSIEGNLSAGPSVVKDFARRDVLAICQEIADATRDSTGPRTFFDVMSPSSTSYQFRTYTAQIGRDHSFPGGISPVLLGLEYGNLTEPELSEDYHDEANVIYSGGQGETTDRVVYEAEDTVRSGRSIWARSERFRDSRQSDSTTAVQDEALSALADGRPRLSFRGRIMDSPGTQYGVHWRWGDKLTALYDNQAIDVTVDVLRVKRDARGEEIDAQVAHDE